MDKLIDSLRDREELIIRKDSRKVLNNVPAYDTICCNESFRVKIKGFPDLYEVLGELSKRAAWFWWKLIKNRNRTNNISKYVPETQSDKNRLTKAYKELNGIGLIVRVKRQYYLINPMAFIPDFSKFDTVRYRWDCLIKEKDEKS